MANQITGQMNLFDVFREKPKEAPILLNPGQVVYIVVRGDIERYKVSDRTWDLSGENRGYDLFDINSNSHGGTTWNFNINRDTFYNKSDAELKATEYLLNNECILAKDMIVKELVAYKHTYLNNEVYEWYTILDNDMIYFHYGCMYDHIGSKDEIKEFEKKVISKSTSIIVYDFIPKFKNMYKCTNSTWNYASAHYQFLHI